MKFLLLILLLLVGCADDSTKVVGVIDGDTIKVVKDKQEYKVRLSNIDCPERRQPFHEKSKQFTSNLAFGKTVDIEQIGTDRYGRVVAEVFLPGRVSLNKELVRSGMAWRYKQYAYDEEYLHLEEEARKAKLGLWIDKNPIPPWEFRKKKPAAASR